MISSKPHHLRELEWLPRISIHDVMYYIMLLTCAKYTLFIDCFGNFFFGGHFCTKDTISVNVFFPLKLLLFLLPLDTYINPSICGSQLSANVSRGVVQIVTSAVHRQVHVAC